MLRGIRTKVPGVEKGKKREGAEERCRQRAECGGVAKVGFRPESAGRRLPPASAPEGAVRLAPGAPTRLLGRRETGAEGPPEEGGRLPHRTRACPPHPRVGTHPRLCRGDPAPPTCQHPAFSLLRARHREARQEGTGSCARCPCPARRGDLCPSRAPGPALTLPAPPHPRPAPSCSLQSFTLRIMNQVWGSTQKVTAPVRTCWEGLTRGFPGCRSPPRPRSPGSPRRAPAATAALRHTPLPAARPPEPQRAGPALVRGKR